jgi:hypothetical protein
MLGTVTVGSTSFTNAIIDYASETMAILYYPSRLGMKGVVAQYVVADNSKYAPLGGANSAPSTSILTIVKPASVTFVQQDGLFVITAAGTDRLYFSTSSVSNFSN